MTGVLDFDEFVQYYERVLKALSAFHLRRQRKLAQREARRRSAQMSGTEGTQSAWSGTDTDSGYPVEQKQSFDEHVDEVIEMAKLKFKELDLDGNGVLDGEDIALLGDWVWSSFHPDGSEAGAEMDESQRDEMRTKLRKRVDANADGQPRQSPAARRPSPAALSKVGSAGGRRAP